MPSVPPSGSLHPAGRRQARLAWGDGFHDEGARALHAASSWDDLSPDEWALPHSRLSVARAGPPPPSCLALLASAARVLRSRFRGVPDAVARAEEADWFAPRVPREALGHLLPVAEGILAGVPLPFDPFSEMAIPVLSGVHPTLFFRDSLAWDRGVAAAWSGAVLRGRRALVPPCVAEVMSDPSTSRDAALEYAVGGPATLRALRQIAAPSMGRSSSPRTAPSQLVPLR